MEKKTNENPPCILVQYSSNFTVNSSLDETYALLVDYNKYLRYHKIYNEDFEDIHDEKVEEILSTFPDLDDYVKKATVQTASVIKENILEELKNYEILAFDIPDGEEIITFFIKTINEENKENFLVLVISYNFDIDIGLFMSIMLDLENFRAYGPFHSGCYEFHMKDSLLEYEFELLTYKNLNTLSNQFIPSIEPDLYKQNKGVYFVIKNNLGDPIIVKHLIHPDDAAIFNEVLTKVDPQVGLLFSLSYNANK